MLQGLQFALSGAMIAVSALAVTFAWGEPGTGVIAEVAGGLVLHVDPGSPAWRDGIRAGDRVMKIVDSLNSDGWQLLTTDGTVERGTSAAVASAALERLRPWSLAAFTLSLVLALVASRRPGVACALLPIMFVASVEPLIVAGTIHATLLAGSTVFGAGGLAVFAFAPSRRWMTLAAAVAVTGMVTALAWVIGVLVVRDMFDPLDGARWTTAVGFSSIGLGLGIRRRQLLAIIASRRTPTFVDLGYGGFVLASAWAAAIVADVPPPLVLVTLAVSVVAYPFWRRTAITAVERLVTSGARREATILAVERERGRLARDIHDSPLQELTGVIRRIETVPGASDEALALRKIAAHLRDVATALQPPVLQDLGVAAAIEDLADTLRGSHPDWGIAVDVDDLTADGRPAYDVELAAFRIMQEASANALAHSSGSKLKITGTISDDSISLDVCDDGRGFSPGDASAARRAGHFGLDSIRDRATAVGATTTVVSNPEGVTVSFRWLART